MLTDAETPRLHPQGLLAKTNPPRFPVRAGLGCRYFGMQSNFELVTPEIAEDYLRHNKINRKVRPLNLQLLESQLQRGEMKTTHQGIAFSKSGDLIDGQHRLMAILNTGIAATLLVVRGVDDDVFDVIDTGAMRQGSDVLSAQGVHNANNASAAVRLYLLYRAMPGHVWTGKMVSRYVSTHLISSCYHRNQDTWQKCVNIGSRHVLRGVVVPSAAICLAYLAVEEFCFTFSYLDHFFERLKKGYGLAQHDPLLAYRNKISGSDPSAQQRLADYIKLFNAYATGQSLKIFKSQQFPPMPLLVSPEESTRFLEYMDQCVA